MEENLSRVRPARRIVLEMVEEYIDTVTGLCQGLEEAAG